MNQGRIEQLDTPAQVYQHPLTVFAARFLGLHNLVPVTRWRDGVAETALGRIPVSTKADLLLLHPDHLTLGPSRSTAEAFTVEGEVSEVTFLGEAYRLKVRHTSGVELQLRIPAAATPPALGHVVSIAVGQVLPVRS